MCLEVLASILSFLDINDHEDHFGNIVLFTSLGLSKPESLQVLWFWLGRTTFSITFGQEKTSWKRNSQLHRKNGPAITAIILPRNPLRKKEWFRIGVLHRVGDLPAIEWSNGDKEWWWKGKCHRDDNPAVITVFGKFWYSHGEFYREKGPVVEWTNENKEWYCHTVKKKVGNPKKTWVLM